MQIKLGLVCTIFCLMWLKAEGGSIAPRSRRSSEDTHEWLQALINEFSNLIVDVHIGKRTDDVVKGPATPATEGDVDKPPLEWLNDMLENWRIYMNETILDGDEDIPEEPQVSGRLSKDAKALGETFDWLSGKFQDFLEIYQKGRDLIFGKDEDKVKAKVKREVKDAAKKEPKEEVKKESKDEVKEEPKEEPKAEQDHWLVWLEKTVEGIKKFQDILGK